MVVTASAKRDLGRRRHAEQMRREDDWVARRGRGVVGHVEDAVGAVREGGIDRPAAMSATWMRLNTWPGLAMFLARPEPHIDQRILSGPIDAAEP